jgi:hypothetical protein
MTTTIQWPATLAAAQQAVDAARAQVASAETPQETYAALRQLRRAMYQAAELTCRTGSAGAAG